MRIIFAAAVALTLSFTVLPAMAAGEGSAVDTTMEELLGDKRTDLLLAADKLDLTKLDYSLESLSEIDTWLAEVHLTNFSEAGNGKAGATLITDGRGRNTLTLAGLYLGETVRRNSDLDWEWVTFEEFIAENPAYAEHYGTSAGLDTYVLVGKQGVATPINAALKRVINGGEDSVAYVGEFLTTPVEFDKAVEGYDPGPEPDVVRREMDEVDNEAPLTTEELNEAVKQQLKETSL